VVVSKNNRSKLKLCLPLCFSSWFFHWTGLFCWRTGWMASVSGTHCWRLHWTAEDFPAFGWRSCPRPNPFYSWGTITRMFILQ